MDNSMKGAKTRWKILAGAVLGHRSLEAASEEHHISGKMSLKLFKTSPPLTYGDTDSTEVNLNSSDWVELTPYDPQQSQIPCTSRTLRLNIGNSLCWAGDSAHHLDERLRILSGFDNTGNVRLWLSELLLAHVFLVPHFYPVLWSRLNLSVERVCELGAGMSGAVGLSVSLSPSSLKPHYILLSDGNDRCVKNLMKVVRYHLRRLDRLDTSTKFEVAKLVWPNQSTEQLSIPDRFRHSFQLVLAADCFFQTGSHRGLLTTIDQLLACDYPATFIALAPLRGKTLPQFTSLAQASGTWLVTCLAPTDYISSSLLTYLLDCVPVDQHILWDSILGHLLVLERKMNE
ncbi:hypothetical protein CRM22_000014 [Opisthorchis felineus]|uniref:Calmodulin-lysine N-methyltransferase n=1 Tax=Opisthorchis felineus TaxID=147828 RepID=A0A4S2MHB2_OPIFE|nr:hypothetical protein CRM22_000014 [Opisthorchis felineus]